MKSLFIIIAMAAMLTACGHRASTDNSEDADSVSVDTIETFKVDSIGIERKDSTAEVFVYVDWPVDGDEILVKAIKKYICEELAARPNQEEQPKANYTDDGKKAVSETMKEMYTSLSEDWKDMREEGYGGETPHSYYLNVFVVENNDHYITYISNSEGYMGGAHGFAICTGMTFNKKTGRRIGYRTEYDAKKETYIVKEQTLFKDVDSASFRKIIKEGVRSYFKEYESVRTDAELKDLLLGVDNVNRIPLPSTPPYFTKQGLYFGYQQYEIAPYAAGMPGFLVPYDKIRPYLTEEAAELIP